MIQGKFFIWTILYGVYMVANLEIEIVQFGRGGIIDTYLLFSCRGRFAKMNERLTTLERRIDFLEARISKSSGD